MNGVAKEYQTYQKSDLMKILAAYAHGNNYLGQTSSATFFEIISRMQDTLTEKSIILDAGCGNGLLSVAIAKELSCTLHGIDLSDELITEATKACSMYQMPPSCKFTVGDFSDLSGIENGFYDAITCIGSLYWGQSLPKVLAEWHRVTKINSQLLIFANLQYSSLTSEETSAIGTTQFIPACTMARELSQCGFAISEWTDATNTYIDWLDRWCRKMHELENELATELGNPQAQQLFRRFSTYLTLATKQSVRRIILKAEHV